MRIRYCGSYHPQKHCEIIVFLYQTFISFVVLRRVLSSHFCLELKGVIGIRVSEEAEINGLDVTELGMEAYPEFSKG